MLLKTDKVIRYSFIAQNKCNDVELTQTTEGKWVTAASTSLDQCGSYRFEYRRSVTERRAYTRRTSLHHSRDVPLEKVITTTPGNIADQIFIT